MSSAAYQATVAATVARLAAVQNTPRPAPTVTPDASKVVHYCGACDLSWRGPEPCWACNAEGRTHSDLATNERLLWALSNASHETFTEGEQCVDS